MDFGAIISRAFNVVLRNRVLWVLGFLAALAGGGSGGGTSVNLPMGGGFPGGFPAGPTGGLDPQTQRFFENLNGPAILAGAFGLACVIFVISIALAVIGLIARAGLIGGVAQIEDTGNTTFGSAWSAGARKFWPILGLNILLLIPVLILVGIAVVLFGGSIVAMVAGATQGDDGGGPAVLGGAFSLLCFGGVLACVGVIYGIIASALQTFGERAIVLEDRGVTASIGRAWEVFRSNLGNIILLAILMFVISLVIGFIVGIIAAALFAPAMLSFISNVSNEAMISTGTIILGALSFIAVVIVSAVIGALYMAFNSALWTLAYRQFTGAGSVTTTATPSPLPMP